MSVYQPDNWIIVELPNNTGYKILAGWSGGYLHGNSWRLNSGIKSYVYKNGFVEFTGHSGAVYKCLMSNECVRHNVHHILEMLKSKGCKWVKFDDVKDTLTRG